ncbi:MAG: hypothetical protein HY094_09530 [Candidatus Melainabacteria bacterium]|nr:hypothetical protein [Candidatus Melainabacteria bacterium]
MTTKPISNTERLKHLQWYADHFPRIKDQHNLVAIASNSKREILDINERTVAIMVILKEGIKAEDEVSPLLDLVKDEDAFPIREYIDKDTIAKYLAKQFSGEQSEKIKEIIDKKQNHALLRGETALALANYGLKTKEFVEKLKYILNDMACDPLFIAGHPMYITNFLAALYETDKDSARSLMKYFSISEHEIQLHLNPIPHLSPSKKTA